MFFKDKNEAELVKLFLEKKHKYKNFKAIQAASASREHYITFSNKVLTVERLERELRIKRKELETALGL